MENTLATKWGVGEEKEGLLFEMVTAGDLGGTRNTVVEGANVNAFTFTEAEMVHCETPLHLALKAPHSNLEMVKLLLALGADPSLKSYDWSCYQYENAKTERLLPHEEAEQLGTPLGGEIAQVLKKAFARQ